MRSISFKGCITDGCIGCVLYNFKVLELSYQVLIVVNLWYYYKISQ